MNTYDYKIFQELKGWQLEMQSKPSFLNSLSKRVQNKINSYIPEKVHSAITTAIKQMFKVVLFGAEITTPPPKTTGTLEEREKIVNEKINFYRNTAAVEGGLTGAGGILLGLADFPLFLAIKIKLLYEVAATYGYDLKDYKERLFILYIFQLAYSSTERRNEIYKKMKEWKKVASELPADINAFDWRTFQQEYRDYIDLAKMAQLVPIIGAPVGAVANFQLTKKLGKTAINAYRQRLQEEGHFNNG